MTKQQVLDLVNVTETPQIRAGTTHPFNDIWIVVVDGRLFCRQYDLAERSWYTAFLEDPRGAIKCGDTEISVSGLVPDDLEAMNPLINAAYIAKYAGRFMRLPHYAHEMTGERFMERTMELVPRMD